MQPRTNPYIHSSKSAAKGVSAKSHKGFKRGGGGAKKKPSKPFKVKAKREGEKESNVVGALSSKGERKRAASAPGEEDSDHKKQKVGVAWETRWWAWL